MTSVLVTGSTGFIGRELCAGLCSRGLNVVGTSRQQRTHEDSDLHENVSYFYDIDFTRPFNLINELAGIDSIIHLAGRAHLPGDLETAEYFVVNRDATIALAQQAVEVGVRHFVFISTIAVFGDAPDAVITEQSEFEPKTPYAASKLEAEQRLIELSNEGGMALTILRPTSVYDVNAPGNIASLMKLVESGFPLPFAKEYNLRSFISLPNLTDFIIEAATNKKNQINVYNLADREVYSTKGIITELAKRAGKQVNFFYCPAWVIKLAMLLLGRKKSINSIYADFIVDSALAYQDMPGIQGPIVFKR